MSMKNTACYRIQLVGNADTVKRMIASLYVVDAKQQDQILKVCICDDLPHVLNAVEAQQRASPSHEIHESGLTLQVGYGTSLTIACKPAYDDEDMCAITPQQEVTIPDEAVWEPNAAFAADFHIRLKRPHETGSVQISITSQDEYGSDIPLNVPPRVRLTWQPKGMVGVQRIKKTWEESEVRAASTLPRNLQAQLPSAQKKTSSLPRYQQPMYLGIEKMLQERTTSPHYQEHNQNDRVTYGSKALPAQDKNWNVVKSPVHPQATPPIKDASDDELPQWARGLGDQYDYDDVVVV